MKKTSEIIFGLATLFLMGLVLWHMMFSNQSTDYQPPSEDIVENIEAISSEFKFELEERVRIEAGQPIEGYEPFMFMQVFPGLLSEDFNGVEAMIGYYEYKNEVLKHELGNVDVIHSAAPAVTADGVKTLLDNVVTRLDVDPETVSVSEIIFHLLQKQKYQESPSEPTEPSAPVEPSHPVACTMDAKICPDGSAVGRTAPDCEFAACPSSSPEQIVCTPQSKIAQACIEIYQPVCGLVDVQCVTTPCNPVPETFSNSCYACAQGNVTSYAEGECSVKN